MNKERIDMKDLPNDLRSHIRRVILMRAIPCAILLAACGALLFFLGERIFNMDNVQMRILCYIVVMLIPFAVTGVPMKLIDRTYCGEVLDARVKRTVDNESYVKPSLEHMYFKNTVYLEIRLDNGKEITVKAYEGRDDDLNPYFYHKGDRVFHLYGSRYTIVLPPETANAVRCPVCGIKNLKENGKCADCGHTLVTK